MPTPRSWPSGLPTVVHLARQDAPPLPERFASDDVRFSDDLVGLFVDLLTAPGDVVLDPFVGFGTSAVAAESRGRQGWGIEIDADRAAYVRTRVDAPERIFTADTRALASLPLPAPMLAIASPPFSAPGDPCEALAGYRGRNPGYEAYLAGLQDVYRQIAARLRPDGWIVIEVANVRTDCGVTTLAWDLARTIGEILPFAGEMVVRWEPTYWYGYDHSYCLLFAAGESR